MEITVVRMQKRNFTIILTLLTYAALALAATGCKLKLLNNAPRDPAGDDGIIDTGGGSSGGSGSASSTTPGIAMVAGGGFSSGTGVKLRLTIGENASTTDMTGTGVRLKLGLAPVIRH